MRCAWLMLVLLGAGSAGALVPWWEDPAWERDEPTAPPWYVRNDGQPSRLYHNGVYVSEETGTNDLALETAWGLVTNRVRLGLVDMTGHGDRMAQIMFIVAPEARLSWYQLSRWYADQVALGITSCVLMGARVIALGEGWGEPNTALSNACRLALASNVVLVCAVPNVEGDLDGALVDYPYRWANEMPNILPVNSTDRNGRHYVPSATGTNCVGAPGRNIYGNGTYSSGTSWATAITAACVSLVQAQRPGDSAAGVVRALREHVAEDGSRRVDVVATLRDWDVPMRLSVQQSKYVTGPWVEIDSVSITNNPPMFFRLEIAK